MPTTTKVTVRPKGVFPVRFTATADGRRRCSKNDWARHQAEIKELYIDQNRRLADVMEALEKKGFVASKKMYKDQFRRWGWPENYNKKKKKDRHATSNKPAAKSLALLDDATITLPAYPLTSKTSRFQHVVIGQMGQLLREDLEFAVLGWGSGFYCKSGPSRAIRDIITGNQLVQKGHPQGWLVVSQGLDQIHTVFSEHTVHAMLDMFVHFHLHCQFPILKLVWKYLANYSAVKFGNSHALHPILEQLWRMCNDEEAYNEIVSQTQRGIYEHYRKIDAPQDPLLLHIMTTGAAPMLTTSLWRDTDWKDFLIRSMSASRMAMKQSFGLHHANYYEWLCRHQSGIRSLCGSDSEAAFELATNILADDAELPIRYPSLYYECLQTLGEYHWRRWQADLDPQNPECRLAISWLDEFANHCAAKSPPKLEEVEMVSKLGTWHRQVGDDIGAAVSAQQHAVMVNRLIPIQS
ncbi:Clr5 domain-containing protein [Xylariales sp. PMI_506]|nr:Clr5 domain-containing protein [Xylariales sp. PMI_506]